MGLTKLQRQLTICVPSYNVESYLEQDLATYADERLVGLVEVIVVNDGSSDKTLQIAEGYVAQMPQVFRLVNKENGGHGSAINTALKLAEGRYFRVIDADDWVTTDDLVAFAEGLRDCECDLVVDVKTEVNMVTLESKRFDLPAGIKLDEDLLFEEVCSTDEFAPFIMIHTLTCKTEFLRAVGFSLLEKTFYEDFEYVVKATLEAHDLRFVDLSVYNYLVGNSSQSVSDANYVRRWADHTRVTNEILRLYGECAPGLSEERRNYLRRRAQLIVNTHYNIALIFDEDRERGRARAEEFAWKLERDYPEIARLTRKRYVLARVLHDLGISSQEELDSLTNRRLLG